MNFDTWNKAIEQLGKEFITIDWGYPVSGLIVRPPPLKVALQQFIKSAGIRVDSPLYSFYRHADGLAFPDVWNGYFIHEIARVAEQFTAERLDLVFGSDGGGAAFSYRRHDGNILHQVSLMPPRIVASDFDEFLRLLRDDVHHYIAGTPGWKFLDGRAAASK